MDEIDQEAEQDASSGLDALIRGVEDFQTEVFEERRDLFEGLADGQHPFAMFITCSDSRVNPNLITQTDPGQLFILRNAGNIIPPYGAAKGGEDATIEYAVMVLNVKHIIVCGHSFCGAIRGLLEPEQIKDLPAVRSWLGHAEATRLIVREKYQHLDGEALQIQAARENAMMQIQNLQTHPSVALRLAQGKLELHAWMYHFETGEVLSYDPTTRTFLPLVNRTDEPIPYPTLDH